MIDFFKKLFGIKTPVDNKSSVDIKPPVDIISTKPSAQIYEELSKTTHKDNPAYLEAKKYEGKKEDDQKFNKFLSGFWKLVGLPNYKTIAGSSFAWCALFIVAMNSQVGQEYISSASAKRQGQYGQTIDWKVNGIPKGAVVHVNHKFDCKSSDSNHVTFADGDCTPEELSKTGATFPGFGGNQNNTVKRSEYSVKEICHVGWPKELELPKKITKSIDCKPKSKTGESTR